MTAAIALTDALDVRQCKRGIVTLFRTPTGWLVVGNSAENPRREYRLTITECDCRTNDKSPNRQGVLSSRYTARTNLGTRELCPHPPAHNGSCHTRKDHCRSARGHQGGAHAMFEQVCKTYDAPKHKVGVDTRPPRVTVSVNGPIGDGTVGNIPAGYQDWLRRNDPEATNPYAGTAAELFTRDELKAFIAEAASAGHTLKARRDGLTYVVDCECGLTREFTTLKAMDKFGADHARQAVAA